jgi:hypothetical protein
MNIFKYYRLTRQWACKTYGLSNAELELLIYLDCKKHFNRKGFIDGTYTMGWDKLRWNRLRKEGWIDVFREGNRKDSQGTMFKVSFKTKTMITRIYKILLGEENPPWGMRSVFYKNKTYTDKVMNKAIDDMIKDKDR